jgi:hypothetical protein
MKFVKTLEFPIVMTITLFLFGLFIYLNYDSIEHPKYRYDIESNEEGHFLVVRYTEDFFSKNDWKFTCPPEQPTIEQARAYRDYLKHHWSEYKRVE